MKITIHRGIDQIGGCIVEISTAKSRVLIDLGENLPNNDIEIRDELANAEAVRQLTNGVDAVLYTHCHGDHVGLSKYVPLGVKQYIGNLAKQLLLIQAKYGANNQRKVRMAQIERFKTYRMKCSFKVGDIKITPYLVSHSTADAYMFLIEAEGLKVLHTGDFRGHGYLSKGLESVLNYVGEVDVLITEGTMLTRQEAQVMSEKELQMEMTKAMQAYKYVFVQCSSTDMERLSTLYSAIPEGRLFVVDNYQEEIMKAFHRANKRYSNWFSFKDRHNYKREDNLMQQMIEKGFCLLIRENGFENKFKQELLAKLPQKDRLLIYSMWAGYLVPGANLNEHHMRLVSEFDNVAYLHTSGHATPDCLALVCERVKASKAIIPIHSELSSLFNSLPIDPTYKSLVMLQSVELEGLSIVVNNPSSV